MSNDSFNEMKELIHKQAYKCLLESNYEEALKAGKDQPPIKNHEGEIISQFPERLLGLEPEEYKGEKTPEYLDALTNIKKSMALTSPHRVLITLDTNIGKGYNYNRRSLFIARPADQIQEDEPRTSQHLNTHAKILKQLHNRKLNKLARKARKN